MSTDESRADIARRLIKQQDTRLSAIQRMIGPHLGDTLEASEVLPESVSSGLLIERTHENDISETSKGFIVREETTNERHGIPVGFPVKVIGPDDTAMDRVTCGVCGLSWDDDVITSYTPAPSGRCPFEWWHEELEVEELEPWEVTVQRAAEALMRALEGVPSNVIHYAVEDARRGMPVLVREMQIRITAERP